VAAGGPSTAGDDREARLGRRSMTMTVCGLETPDTLDSGTIFFFFGGCHETNRAEEGEALHGWLKEELEMGGGKPTALVWRWNSAQRCPDGEQASNWPRYEEGKTGQ